MGVRGLGFSFWKIRSSFFWKIISHSGEWNDGETRKDGNRFVTVIVTGMVIAIATVIVLGMSVVTATATATATLTDTNRPRQKSPDHPGR